MIARGKRRECELAHRKFSDFSAAKRHHKTTIFFYIVLVPTLATLYFNIQLIDSNHYLVNAKDSSRSSNNQPEQQETPSKGKQNDDLSVSESVDSSTISHQIMIDGWSNVTQMWPTTDTSYSSQNGNNQQKMPFIFYDKARKTDYDLLLSMNQTVRDMLNNFTNNQVQVNLSFEYYFDHDIKVTSLPAIKVDVDRVTSHHLMPNGQIFLKKWITFNEELPYSRGRIADDWLKISLVIRESPTLVAMRKLKLTFFIKTVDQNSVQPPDNSQFVPFNDQQYQQQPVQQNEQSQQNSYDQQTLPGDQSQPNLEVPPVTAPSDSSSTPVSYSSPAPGPTGDIRQPSPLNAINLDITPVRHRVGKRQVNPLEQSFGPIEFTCFNSCECNWLSASDGQIQWSLTRMPATNKRVTLGYYYNSNQANVGDISKLLNIYLSETESATKATQLSDHCIDLALYVSGASAKLKMVKLTKKPSYRADEINWTRGNTLMTFAPTAVEDNRLSLSSANYGVNVASNDGWIEETICFNEFFGTENCGSGQCGIGFEMIVNGVESNSPNGNNGVTDGAVVAVALLSGRVNNKPLNKIMPRWLNTWQRHEISPTANWNFRPLFDWKINESNVTMKNLYDQAIYIVTSDWLQYTPNLGMEGALVVSTLIGDESILNRTATLDDPLLNGQTMFSVNLSMAIVDSDYSKQHEKIEVVEVSIKPNATDQLHDLVGGNISSNLSPFFLDTSGKLKLKDNKLFKIVLTMNISYANYKSRLDNSLGQLLDSGAIQFDIKLANVSISDRCYPSPCSFGSCEQDGTDLEDWHCSCQDKYWGRRCNFGRWCDHPHIVQQQQQYAVRNPQSKLANLQSGVKLITGNEYCSQKLGPGYNCTNKEVPLDDNSYDGEDKTIHCSCKSDFYLSSDLKCRQAHKCNSLMCPSIGMICDATKPFNETKPCRCDESQDWYEDPADPKNNCIRKQCHDRLQECGFEAHICLPTIPGEKPICKCGDKFKLEINPQDGKKMCKSTACALPSLNDCDQICIPNDNDRQRPYDCSCHPGFKLSNDKKTCQPDNNQPLNCKTQCQGPNQICTQSGCKCKPGHVAEGEVVVDNKNNPLMKYTQSVRCLNVCTTSYAENREVFERIQSVCPLGLCDPVTFKCRCSDESHSGSLVSSRYEPRYNVTVANENGEGGVANVSPLCRLKRVCEKGTSSFNVCNNQGAICVPDYSKPSMFDCVCPPSTEKKLFGQGAINEFVCELKCKRFDCISQQAVCKLVDKDKVSCDCLPGFIYNQTDRKCYIAKYSYKFQLVIANKYYEPEIRYHRIVPIVNGTVMLAQGDPGFYQPVDVLADSPYSHPQFQKSSLPQKLASPGDTNNNHDKVELLEHEPLPLEQQEQKAIFITDFNQCNVTTLISKSILEDPYESDFEPFLDTIDECNARIHANIKMYKLNSDLIEDIKQSLRQKIYQQFTITTTNSSCIETDNTSQYLNCTIYLQSNTPVDKSLVEDVFTECDSNGADSRFCWIKPRMLLQRLHDNNQQNSTAVTIIGQPITPEGIAKQKIGFQQIVPCELNNFCGPEAQSIRLNDDASYCSCKCPTNVETIDVKDLLPPHEDFAPMLVKQICAPFNHCLSNSTFCINKPGSACHYDDRSGTECKCIPFSYENKEGHCVEVAFSEIDNTLIILVVLLGTALVVSVTINLIAAAKSGKFIGKSKEYPLNEFTVHQGNARTAGLTNQAFLRD